MNGGRQGERRVERGDLLSVLLGSWNAIRETYPETPPVILTVGHDAARRTRTQLLGCFSTARWGPEMSISPEEKAVRIELADALARDDLAAAMSADAQLFLLAAQHLSSDLSRARSEVFITDHAITAGPEVLLGVLIHEAAHAVAQRRGINDTSPRGGYHNARFKALAEEMGLTPRVRDRHRGWSTSEFTCGTLQRFGHQLADLAEAAGAYTPKRDTTPIKVVLDCDCGRLVRSVRKTSGWPQVVGCSSCGHRLALGAAGAWIGLSDLDPDHHARRLSLTAGRGEGKSENWQHSSEIG